MEIRRLKRLKESNEKWMGKNINKSYRCWSDKKNFKNSPLPFERLKKLITIETT